jgi:hypothetical protein
MEWQERARDLVVAEIMLLSGAERENLIQGHAWILHSNVFGRLFDVDDDGLCAGGCPKSVLVAGSILLF